MLEGTSALTRTESTSYRPGGGKPPYCVVKTRSGSCSHKLDGTFVDRRAPLVVGDRVHALPYFREVIGELVVSGDLQVLYTAGVFPPNHGCKSALAPVVISGAVWGGALCPPLGAFAPSVDPDIMGDMVAIATTKALANARKSVNNLPLLIAERRQTVEMIGRLLRRLNLKTLVLQRESIMRYLRTARKNRKQVANDIASEHLQFLFGVLPLVSEIEGLVEQLAASRSIVITGRGRMASDNVTVADPFDRVVRVSASNGVNVDTPARITPRTEVRHSARVSLRYEIASEAAQRLRDNGFNPIATAYDLIPLSFLSDFVSNTGQWLRAYDPMLGATFVTGSVSTWHEWKIGYEVAGSRTVSSFGDITITTGSIDVVRRGMRTERRVFDTEPDPSWRLINTMTLGKAIIGVSLAVQRFVKPTRDAIKQRPFRYKGKRPKYLPPIRYRKENK